MTNETDLLGDTDDLRSILQSRAALAPNPDDLIPATRPLARRRRQRRRGAMFGGVVVLTTLALIGATMLRSVEASVTPSGPPLIPPVFPFSVGPLPDGLALASWTSLGSDIPHDAFTLDTMSFSGPDTDVIVEWTNYDPALTVTPQSVPRTTVTVHGVAAVAVGLNGQVTSVSWPVAPLRWINVATGSPKAIPESTLLAIADAVTATPSSPPTTLDIAHLPPGFREFSWQHDQQGRVIDDSVELCAPTTVPQVSPDPNCLTVIASNGSQTGTRAVFASLGRIPIQHVRWIRPGMWVGVYPYFPAGISAAEIDGLLREVSVG